VPPPFDGVLRRLDPPVQRMLSAYTRVRPDPITAAFVEAISDHTMATPTHILSLLEPSQGRLACLATIEMGTMVR
jgi:hypothetical protein